MQLGLSAWWELPDTAHLVAVATSCCKPTTNRFQQFFVRRSQLGRQSTRAVETVQELGRVSEQDMSILLRTSQKECCVVCGISLCPVGKKCRISTRYVERFLMARRPGRWSSMHRYTSTYILGAWAVMFSIFLHLPCPAMDLEVCGCLMWASVHRLSRYR